MPTMPKKTVALNEMHAADVINNVLASDPNLQNIPPVLKAGQELTDDNGNTRQVSPREALQSLNGVGEVVMSFQANQNAFLGALVNRIARVMITSRLYENPWSFFKKGFLEYGETVEEIFVSMARPYQYDMYKAEKDVFKIRKPDVNAAFHTMNYKKFYPTTVNNDELRTAFLSWQGITDLIARIIEQVYTGANYDEFLVMKYMLARMVLDGKIYASQIPSITADNARSVTTTMVAQAKNLSYMSNKYNMAGVTTYTDPRYLYTILTSEVSSIFDVEVLALSFNMNKAELIGNIIGVDGFGQIDAARLALIFEDDPYTTYVPFTEDELTRLSSIAALMVDVNFFMIFDNFYNMTDIYNPEGLYWNYFYHVRKTFSASPFANAIVYTTTENTVTGVTVSPSTATGTKNQSVQFTANVATTGLASKGVAWTLTGTDDVVSTIDATGKVWISPNETNTSLTVTATSTFDTTKAGTATLTIS